MEILKMQAGHICEVLSLWEGCDGIGLDEDTDSPEAIGRHLERNSGMSFVAVKDGAVIGAVLCGCDGRRGYLHHLAVLPSFRRQGIGTALVEHSLAGLKSVGIGKCNIFLYKDNASGRRFWEKTGWQQPENLTILSKVY